MALPPRDFRFHGQGGIRTLETLAGLPVFETGSFSHSDTCPGGQHESRGGKVTTAPASAKRPPHGAPDIESSWGWMTVS